MSDLSPVVAEGMARIATGWRIGYAPEYSFPWFVYNPGRGKAGARDYTNPHQAKAEYLRLTEAEARKELGRS